jgi:hypothetical protein
MDAMEAPEERFFKTCPNLQHTPAGLSHEAK